MQEVAYPKMAGEGHESSWLVVVIVVRRECFTRTSRIEDRFPKQVMLCLRDAAAEMVHPPQKAASIPTLISNTLGVYVHLILKGFFLGGVGDKKCVQNFDRFGLVAKTHFSSLCVVTYLSLCIA